MECLGRGVSAYLVSIPQASGNDADNLEYDFETAPTLNFKFHSSILTVYWFSLKLCVYHYHLGCL